MSDIRIKRVYEPAAAEDGTRVLVDRLWPRGLKRDAAKIDLWVKDVAPSTELRRWFGHDPSRWSEFRKRYRAELAHNPGATAVVEELTKKRKPLTLLFGAKDSEHNNAVVLRDFLSS